MSKKKPGKKRPDKVYKAYKIEGGHIIKQRKSCPKCGAGVFMAQHKDRQACGKCGYTEFMSKKTQK